MKKFRFRYENILKMRLDAEDDIKTKLKKLNQELHQLENDKLVLENSYRVYKHEVQQLLENGLKGYEVQRINSFQSYYRGKIEETELEIKHMERRIEDVKQDLMEAIKERKIMEKIKEKDFKIYLEAINAMEGKSTEEVVNFQNSRKSGG